MGRPQVLLQHPEKKNLNRINYKNKAALCFRIITVVLATFLTNNASSNIVLPALTQV